MLSSASDKAKLFAENLSKNSNLDDSGIFLSVFPSRTNLTLHNISVTFKMVKKVIMNLDLLKASGPDFIPVVVLRTVSRNFNWLNSSTSVLRSLVFQTVGERSTAKNYRLVNLVSVVNKVIEKPVNIWIVDHLEKEKCGLFF